MIIGKYKWFALNLVHVGLATLFMALSSCGTATNTVTYPLSESKFKDTRFLDTIQEKTTFYFGIINTEGYDRFGGTVFEDLQRKITLRNSVSDAPKRIDYYYGEVLSKGLNTVFIVNGVYVNEPKLVKLNVDSTSSIVEVQKVVQNQVKSTPPEAAAVLIQAKKESNPQPAQKIKNETAEESVEKLDDRLIIIACFGKIISKKKCSYLIEMNFLKSHITGLKVGFGYTLQIFQDIGFGRPKKFFPMHGGLIMVNN